MNKGIKKELKLFKKEFDYKDKIYLSLIAVLLLSIITLNISHQKEHQWCEYFYDEYGRAM